MTIRFRTRTSVAIAASVLSVAALADARTQPGASGYAVGVPGTAAYQNPTAEHPIGVQNGRIGIFSATYAAELGELGWIVPLYMDNTGSKAPVVSARAGDGSLFGTNDTTCRGHRLNQNGTVAASTSVVTWSSSSDETKTLPSTTLASGQQYIVGCWISRNFGRVNSVSYSP